MQHNGLINNLAIIFFIKCIFGMNKSIPNIIVINQLIISSNNSRAVIPNVGILTPSSEFTTLHGPVMDPYRLY